MLSHPPPPGVPPPNNPRRDANNTNNNYPPPPPQGTASASASAPPPLGGSRPPIAPPAFQYAPPPAQPPMAQKSNFQQQYAPPPRATPVQAHPPAAFPAAAPPVALPQQHHSHQQPPQANGTAGGYGGGYHDNHDYYDEDSGALTSTINLMASAATSIFSRVNTQMNNAKSPSKSSKAVAQQQQQMEEEPVVPSSYLDASSSYFATTNDYDDLSGKNSSDNQLNTSIPPPPAAPPPASLDTAPPVANTVVTKTPTPASVALNTPSKTPSKSVQLRETPPARSSLRSASRPRSLPRPPSKGSTLKSSSTPSSSSRQSRSTTPNTGARAETPSGRSRFRLPPARSRTPPRALHMSPMAAKKSTTTTTAEDDTTILTSNTSRGTPMKASHVVPSLDKESKSVVSEEEPSKSLTVEPEKPSDPVQTVQTKQSIQAEEETKVDSDLPPGWSAAIDPASGRTYFFNSQTNERTWEKPFVTQPQQETELPAEAVQQPETEKPSVSATPSSGEAAAVGGSVPEETPSETVYSSAAATEGSVVAEPTNADTVPPTTSDGEVAIEPENEVETSHADLPDGWLQATDPQTSRVYFYNPETGETSWTRPEPEISKPSAEEGPAESLTPDLGPPPSRVDNLPTEPSDAVSSEEAVAVEPNDDVTTDEPAFEIAPQSGGTFEDVDLDAAPSTSEARILPKGWAEGFDEASSRPYYYNVTTGESSWDFPADQQQASAQLVSPETKVDGVEEVTETTVELQNASEEGPESGDRLSHVLEETPENTEIQNGDMRPSVASTTHTTVDAPVTLDKEDSLPEPGPVNQTHALTPIDGIVAEKHTDDSQNNMPEIAGDERDVKIPLEGTVEDDSVEQMIGSKQSEESQTILPDDSEEAVYMVLPDGWVEAFDPNSNRNYYYNAETGQTTWEHPGGTVPSEDKESATVDHDEPSRTTNESKSSLPHGWSEDVHPETGQIFYVNLSTGQTSWEQPSDEKDMTGDGEDIVHEKDVVDTNSAHKGGKDGMPLEPCAVVPPQEKINKQAEQTEEKLQQIEAEVHIAEEPVQPAADQTGVEHSPDIPPRWAQSVDAETGETFYYNENTGERSWEPPFLSSTSEIKPENPADAVAMDEPEIRPSQTGDEIAQEISGEAEKEEDQQSSDDLPRGWTQSVDFTTGKPFYYNEITGDSNWERPTECLEIGQSAHTVDTSQGAYASDMQPEQDTERSFVEDHPAQPKPTEHKSVAVSVLPEGWTQSVDGSTGKPFYYNEMTGESRWEPPTASEEIAEANDTSNLVEIVQGTHAAEEAESEIVQADPSRDDTFEKVQEVPPSLPEGWVQSVDPDSGQAFYYNEATGKSSWELPTISVATEAEASGTTDAQELDHHMQTQKEKEEAEREILHTDTSAEYVFDEIKEPPPSLPEGWMQSVDEDTGKAFYYNEATGETSWEPPGISTTEEVDEILANDSTGPLEINQSIQAAAELEGASEKDMSTDEALEVLQDVPAGLPEGWTQSVDPDTGRAFYYNEVSGESSWEPPKPMQSTFDVAEADTLLVEDQLGQVKETVDDTAVDVAKIDAEQVVSEDAIVGNDSPPHGEEMSSQEDDAGPLLIGWQAVPDQQSGGVYYFNEATGETSWVKPGENAEERDAILDTPEVMALPDAEKEELIPPPRGATTVVVSNNALPEGWLESTDADSGEVYYYNEATGETSWEKPGTMNPEDTQGNYGEEIDIADVARDEDHDVDHSLEQTDTGVEANEIDQGIHVLPEGWEEAIDPDSGGVYYFNESTGETRWTFPGATEQDDSQTPHKGEWFSEDQSRKTSLNASLSTSAREKPAWKGAPFCASIGFGGRVCFTRGSTVIVQPMHEMIPREMVTSLEKTKNSRGITGPLSTCSDKCAQNHISSIAEADRNDLLWGLIDITARSKGRLRSQGGSQQESIINLLRNPTTQGNGERGLNGHTFQTTSSAQESDHDLRTIEDLIVQGRREEAVDEAIRCNQYGLALFIAGMCSHELYQFVSEKFMENMFVRGSPLYTVASLSLQRESSTAGLGSLYGPDMEVLKNSWKSHLTALISNRVPEWDKAISTLGDRLRSIGEFSAAHFCYMVSGISMSSPTKKNARWTLAGCSMGPLDVSLKTDESLRAFARTEGFEWAKRRANARASMKSLQPFKLVYCHILLDIGLSSIAKAYLDALLPYLEHASDDSNPQYLAPLVPLCHCVAWNDRSGLRQHARSLYGRLNREGFVVEGSALEEVEADNDVSFLTAHSTLDAKKAVELVPSQIDEPQVGRETVEPERNSPPAMPLATMKPITLKALGETTPTITEDQTAKSFPERNGSSENLPPPIPPSVPAPKEPETTMNGAAVSTPRKHAAPPASAPAMLEKQKTPTSAQKRSMLGGLLDALRPKPKGKEADLGEKMEAYYDKDKKRWIFPGDDPDVAAAAAGPPPTSTELKEKAPVAEEKKAPADPLSALMAPPSRAPRSAIPRNRVAPSNGAGAGLPPAPPKFAVFSPKPN